MGCTNSKAEEPLTTPTSVVPTQLAKKAVVEETPSPPKEVTWKTVHSAVRWNKAEEAKAMMLGNLEFVNCQDTTNLNRPIHIAAQNGHLELIEFMVANGVALDEPNKKGNTGLHMAVGYDYYAVAKVLIDAGAGKEVTNEAGHKAIYGIDGDKTLGLIALISAVSAAEVDNAFVLCESELELLKAQKHQVVQGGLKTKKTLGAAWTPEHQTLFKDLMAKL